MAWWAPGWETSGRELAEGFRYAPWDAPPEPFERVGPTRPMRRVARGRWPGAPGPVYVKHTRPVTALDRLRRRLLGGKGAREARLLQALAARGLPVPIVVGFEDDVVVTKVVAGLRPLPPWEEASRAQVAACGALLGRAWAAGLRHRDLHRGNLGWDGRRAVLVDVGGARLGRRDAPVRTLARARHAVFGEASLAQRRRALGAFLEAADLAGEDVRALIDRVEREARRIARAYRRGRDRRATRNGRHFRIERREDGVRLAARRDAPEACVRDAPGWLRSRARAERALKAGGRVVRVRPEAHAEDVVLKRYEGVVPGRLARAERAFRRQVQLEHRGVRAPRAWLAVSRRGGESLLVSEAVDALDLHAFVTTGAWTAATPTKRRALARALGRFLRHLHEAEISHRDLKAPNLLVDAGSRRFWIADLDGARVHRQPLGWPRRARDLARLDASLAVSRTTRLRAWRAYRDAHPRAEVDERDVLRRIASRVARKRGPSNRPR